MLWPSLSLPIAYSLSSVPRQVAGGVDGHVAPGVPGVIAGAGVASRHVPPPHWSVVTDAKTELPCDDGGAPLVSGDLQARPGAHCVHTVPGPASGPCTSLYLLPTASRPGQGRLTGPRPPARALTPASPLTPELRLSWPHTPGPGPIWWKVSVYCTLCTPQHTANNLTGISALCWQASPGSRTGQCAPIKLLALHFLTNVYESIKYTYLLKMSRYSMDNIFELIQILTICPYIEELEE